MYNVQVRPEAIQSGCGLMEVGVLGRESVTLRTTWHAWRYHVDLCRTAAALCRR